MVDFPDSVAFRVSTADLNGAIEILRALGGLAEHPAAYQALVLERSRRELQSPPQEIRLLREAFEALPHAVQQLLMAEPRPGGFPPNWGSGPSTCPIPIPDSRQWPQAPSRLTG
jgi:hypothetical protein